MSLKIELLEASFAAVAPRADELADKFYGRLFREHPQVRPLFKAPQAEQKKKLVASLAMIVQSLRNPDALRAYAEQLGVRHLDYNVAREHYPIVGQNLLATLADVAGDAWNDELEAAWAEAYGAIQAMIFEALDRHEAQAQVAV